MPDLHSGAMVHSPTTDPASREPVPEGTPSTEAERALARLAGAESVIVTGHQQPDADVIGSAAVLHAVLTALGKSVELILPDPAPRHLKGLMEPFPFRVAEGGPLPLADLVVLVDGSDPGRMGELGERLLAQDPRPDLLVVDHHLHSGEPTWDFGFRDPSAAATAVMAVRLAKHFGVRLSPAAAELGMAALVSDTGWFRFESTNVEAFETAAAFLDAGAHPDRVFAQMRGDDDPELPGHLSRLLGAASYRADGRIALLPVDPELAAQTSGTDPARVFETLRTVRGVQAVVCVRARDDGSVKLSLRTGAPLDAARIAGSFGGGGHARAAGATLGVLGDLDFDAYCERSVAAVVEALEQLGRGPLS